jgi:hypothetical protein
MCVCLVFVNNHSHLLSLPLQEIKRKRQEGLKPSSSTGRLVEDSHSGAYNKDAHHHPSLVQSQPAASRSHHNNNNNNNTSASAATASTKRSNTLPDNVKAGLKNKSKSDWDWDAGNFFNVSYADRYEKGERKTTVSSPPVCGLGTAIVRKKERKKMKRQGQREQNERNKNKRLLNKSNNCSHKRMQKTCSQSLLPRPVALPSLLLVQQRPLQMPLLLSVMDPLLPLQCHQQLWLMTPCPNFWKRRCRLPPNVPLRCHHPQHPPLHRPLNPPPPLVAP